MVSARGELIILSEATESYYIAAFGLGFIIGPAIGGLLGSFGPRVPFMAAGALTLVNWLYGFFILPESLLPENRRRFA